MGKSIGRTRFTQKEIRRFNTRLDESLHALEQMLAVPDFGEGESSIGAELELYVIDESGKALPISKRLVELADDERLTLEINRYNLEANLTPGPMKGNSLKRIEDEMLEMLATLNTLAEGQGARVIPIGILPTLRPRDLTLDMMTPDKRYQALSKELRKRRGEKFRIRLRGRERVSFGTDSVTPEGANTSLQVHYRAHPDSFVDLYNAIQLVTPLVLGLAVNSPYVLGREIWQETRIELFRQSIDGRNRKRRELDLPARVNFGHGWLRRSVLELFAESVHLFEPLLPVCSDEKPLEVLTKGGVPAFEELGLQMGTTWPWNRAVYDAHDKGHVRIELRALPAGPSPVDMLANAAFALGLAEGLVGNIENLLHAIPYASLERNLNEAARNGMDATLLWPSRTTKRLDSYPLVDIVKQLLPTAEEGLSASGVADDDRRRYLACIEQRVAARQTGASWQTGSCQRYREKGASRKSALRAMVNDYAQLSLSNLPVAEWPLP